MGQNCLRSYRGANPQRRRVGLTSAGLGGHLCHPSLPHPIPNTRTAAKHRELELKWEASAQQVAGQGAAGEREQQGRHVEERFPEEVQGSQPPRWLDTPTRAHQRPSPQMRAAQQVERQLEAQQRRGGRQPIAQPALRADTVDELAVGVQAGQPCAQVWKKLLDPTLRREHVIVAWRVLHACLMVGDLWGHILKGDDLRDDQTDARKLLLEGGIRMSSQLLLHDYITAYRNNLLTAGVQCMEESLLVSLFIKGLTPELKKAVLRDSVPFPAFTLAQAIDSARQAQRAAEILAEAVGTKRHVAAVQARQLTEGLEKAGNPRPPRSTQSDPPAKVPARSRGFRAGMAAGPAAGMRVILKQKAEEAAEQSSMKPGQYCHHCYDPRHLKPLCPYSGFPALEARKLSGYPRPPADAKATGKRHSEPNDSEPKKGKLASANGKFDVANNQPVICEHYVKVQLRINSFCCMCLLTVMPDLVHAYDVLLGADWLTVQGALVDYVDKTLTLRTAQERAVGHSIPLQSDGKPPARPSYRMSKPEQDELRKQITDLLAKGLIEPSSSPYAAPVLFVQKKSGELRMCIDYRQLNKITIRDQYPLPRIDDLFDQLAGKTVFSSLDLQAGYHQIRIPAEDVPKTAFRTPMGHYQFKVLCFGLTNAPATFQRVMNEAFAEVINDCALVYLDDILVMSKDSEEHLVHLRRVFDLLRKNKFYAKLSKCEFMQRTLKFLGHIISAQGISVDPCKVTAISEWPVPTSLKTLQSFLGAANYVRKFVHNFSTIAAPLTNLTGPKKESFPWKAWPQAELDAFNALKQAISNVPLLKLPDHSKPFQVHCDASLEGIGAVLMQDGYPLAYYSRKLIPAEINYTTGEQELLALVSACQQWRCYLEGVPFTLPPTKRVTWAADVPADGEPSAPKPPGPLSNLHEWLVRAYAADSNFTKRRKTKNFYLDDNGLWRHNKRRTIIVPRDKQLREHILHEMHDAKYAGHVGITKTLERVMRVFWKSADSMFQVGDRVLLSTMNLRNMVGKARKLLPRYVGPFRIEAHVGRDAVKLTLPQAMSRIHPVFHVSLLRPYEGNFGRLPPTELGWLDDSPQYEVERIVNHRHVRAAWEWVLDVYGRLTGTRPPSGDAMLFLSGRPTRGEAPPFQPLDSQPFGSPSLDPMDAEAAAPTAPCRTGVTGPGADAPLPAQELGPSTGLGSRFGSVRGGSVALFANFCKAGLGARAAVRRAATNSMCYNGFERNQKRHQRAALNRMGVAARIGAEFAAWSLAYCESNLKARLGLRLCYIGTVSLITL
ncbi:hypothetical protein QJQ45_004612 [Haematococcus lacustris]|nr:hypothetical protein QJQ45_004612 [Haematococcus lacustris]